MNKILIALVLAVVMSGNAYANFITDYFKTPKEICLEAVENGKLFDEYKDEYEPRHNRRDYAYKGKTYRHFYKQNKLVRGPNFGNHPEDNCILCAEDNASTENVLGGYDDPFCYPSD